MFDKEKAKYEAHKVGCSVLELLYICWHCDVCSTLRNTLDPITKRFLDSSSFIRKDFGDLVIWI